MGKYGTALIDFVVFDGETAEGVMAKMADGFDVTLTLHAEVGTSGGNPVARITGPREIVDQFLEFHGYDATEVRDYV